MLRFSIGFCLALAAVPTLPASAATLVTTVYSQNTADVVDWFTVSQTGTYIVTTAGGMGGGARGGAGAIMTAQFQFNAGDSFVMLIGGAGASNGSAGAGGSGTFFATNSMRPEAMLVAGGGGGSGKLSNYPNLFNTYGGDASFTTSGGKGGGSLDGDWRGWVGGSGGTGGLSGSEPGDGGGGFWRGSNGLKPPQDYGASFLEVLESEQESRTGLPTKVNGGTSFGGRAGGGGGGYSGGGAGNDNRQPRLGSDADYGGGGGGGSFVSSLATLLGTDYNRGSGWIRIDLITTSSPPPTGVDPTSSVPEPASWAMMIGGFALVGGAMRRRSGTISLTV